MPKRERKQQRNSKISFVLYLRSALFLTWFVVISVAMHIACLPTLLLERKNASWVPRAWAKAMLWGLKTFAGLGYEVRGAKHLIHGGVLVASKHYCMWETVALFALLDDPAVVIKRELLRVPLYGWYARKQENIFIDRKAGASAVRAMMTAARRALAESRPILIFPEGTRKDIGATPDYKPGVAGLYTELEVPCVPVALNSGLFWLAGGWLKKPGTIVVEFLETIPPGLARQEFMAELETRIETASARLIAEGRAQLAGR
jgi:1-acyl-sn-glycerol-3-phosphate acyltransferase